MRKHIIRHVRITFKPLSINNNGLNTLFTTYPITLDKITRITLAIHSQYLSSKGVLANAIASPINTIT